MFKAIWNVVSTTLTIYSILSKIEAAQKLSEKIENDEAIFSEFDQIVTGQ